VQAEGSSIPIPLDPDRMEQVLINLLHNAIKFTPAGGRIDVRVSQAGRETTIEVADTGIGIPAEELERLFERFYKSDRARRSEGTGLGLAIAKHIVQAHGGTITVESEEGHGSTFRIVLPGRRIPKSRQRA
jgi:two-component system phosphate regulon sensor histidine kinase PhoR